MFSRKLNRVNNNLIQENLILILRLHRKNIVNDLYYK